VNGLRGEVRETPTPRELEVLRATLAEGTEAAAAGRLGISEHTANELTRRLYRRLDVTNRTDAALRLVRSGYCICAVRGTWSYGPGFRECRVCGAREA